MKGTRFCGLLFSVSSPSKLATMHSWRRDISYLQRFVITNALVKTRGKKYLPIYC
jgi:hypothetical protein